jgi:hypothetical protein
LATLRSGCLSFEASARNARREVDSLGLFATETPAQATREPAGPSHRGFVKASQDLLALANDASMFISRGDAEPIAHVIFPDDIVGAFDMLR